MEKVELGRSVGPLEIIGGSTGTGKSVLMENIVKDELGRVNATVSMSDFELAVFDDVLSWVDTKDSDFTADLTTKDAIIAYWNERLN